MKTEHGTARLCATERLVQDSRMNVCVNWALPDWHAEDRLVLQAMESLNSKVCISRCTKAVKLRWIYSLSWYLKCMPLHANAGKHTTTPTHVNPLYLPFFLNLNFSSSSLSLSESCTANRFCFLAVGPLSRLDAGRFPFTVCDLILLSSTCSVRS